MSVRIDNARVSPCKIVFFRERPYIKPNQVLFIDNRPGREHSYHDKLVDVFGLLRNAELEISSDSTPKLKEVIKRGLSNGGFKDTTQAAIWLKSINDYADFPGFNIEPFELLVVHAETHIHEIIDAIIEQDSWPAGIILSGSPKMLSEDIMDPIIQQTLSLIDFVLEKGIPILGICFGLHLLAAAKFGTLAKWIITFKNMNVEFHPRSKANDKFTDCIPGKRYAIYGTSLIKRAIRHKVLNAVDKIIGLEVHSQYLPLDHPNIPEEHVLAISERFFRKGRMSKARDQYQQGMIEVLEIGPVAIGTQLHPELQPELLLALSYLPEISAWLRSEGQDIQRLRQELSSYPKSVYAGQRVGYNWVKRILGPDYIRKTISDEQAIRVALDRLRHRDPLWGKFNITSENFF